MTRPFLLKLLTVAVCAALPTLAIAQISTSEGEKRCKAGLERQNQLCEGRPATGWRSRQVCRDGNLDFFKRCMRNAHVGDRNYVPPNDPR